ncbi:RING-type E3 ubiquitin transferase [Malassezia cuniculi]|uniref:RING-type E3 ubiquitin transferase n=1 Tax=Malassezia cuniculi TaxID=948313 RepID=A0AAF0EXK3_9BASI|nr:RING-type E3 ubiquitin transferase [Malassezia cuniculi]
MSYHNSVDPLKEHETLCRVFQVSLVPTEDEKLVFIKDVAADLSSAGGPGEWPLTVLISSLMADRVLVSRLELNERDTSFDYLIGAWIRANNEVTKAADENTRSVWIEVRRLIAGYVGLVVQMPDMFPGGDKDGVAVSPKSLIPSFLRLSSFESFNEDADPLSDGQWASVPTKDAQDFFLDLVNRFPPEDGMEDVIGRGLFELVQCVSLGDVAYSNLSPDVPAGQRHQPVDPAVATMMHYLNPQTVPDEGLTIASIEWRHYLRTMSAAVSCKAVAAALPLFSIFDPGASARSIEREALFGPLLRLSCLPDAYPSVVHGQFNNGLTSPQVSQNVDDIRLSLRVVQSENFAMWNTMVRAGTAPRRRILSMWARILEINSKRAGLHVDRAQCSSDAFMVNMGDMLIQFCGPFVDMEASKIDRIDSDYARYQRRWDTSSLTRIHATESEAVAWMDSAPNDADPNFTTEVFFMAIRYIALGIAPVMRQIDECDKERQRFKERLSELEESQPTWANTPLAVHYEGLIKRLNLQLNVIKTEIIATHAVLLEGEFMTRLIRFIAFVMTWLVRQADPCQAYPQKQIELPLPDEVPDRFAMLPEHVLDDAVEVLLFYARRRPDQIDKSVIQNVALFCTVFLSATSYVRNPFLKAKIVELMAFGVSSYGDLHQGLLGSIVHTHPVVLENLMPGLVKVWIEVESTGSSTQFYDKFNIRYHLSLIFKQIWENPAHAARLRRESVEQSARFVVFINRLMNDVTYLVDDALEKLMEIHDVETAMDEPEWQEHSNEERERNESHMHSISVQARSDLMLGSAFLDQLIRLAGEAPQAFMTTEIVDRLAAMLDYNLDTMVGPRCQGLRLKHPDQVGFDPKSLLKKILGVYIALADCEEFPRAIARDGRSYRAALFERAMQIATKHSLLAPTDIDVLKELLQHTEAALQAEVDEEENLGEIPDDYLDPVMATLMRNPVVLPSSRKVVDLSTIRAHLLNDDTDPFNRLPLKLEDVKPATELREEIQRWLAEKRGSAGVSER